MSFENIIGSKSKISILTLLFSDIAVGYTFLKLSKVSGVPYSVVHRDMKLLKAENFVILKRVGNKCIVTLNNDHIDFEKIKYLFEKKVSVLKKLFKSEKGLIFVHHNADPDAVGSAIALARGLAQGGLKCDIVALDGLSKQSKAVLTKYPYPILETVESFPDLVFILDTSSYEQINNIEIPETSKVVVIDHHTRGTIAKRADLKLIDTEAHATGILVYDLLKSSGVKITAEIAFFLLVAIVADTSFLRLVNSKDLKIVSHLMEYTSLDDVISILSVKVDLSQRIAISKAVARSKVYRFDRLIVVLSKVGSFESAVARTFVNSFADIAIVENVHSGSVRISGRARTHLADKINLATIFKSIGPLIKGNAGGHVTAASANGTDDSKMYEVRAQLFDKISKIFKVAPKQI
ncbi:MAG: DHH family phosphoesterase [DPANN group archaeon]|nr:DHH family phosphoesterase [DPANN group archaeon]